MNAETALMFGAPLRTDLINAAESAVRFYDQMRTEHDEYTSRRAAQLYLARKCPGVDLEDAAVALADALALRAQYKPEG